MEASEQQGKLRPLFAARRKDIENLALDMIPCQDMAAPQAGGP
jgi:hypothetical protein